MHYYRKPEKNLDSFVQMNEEQFKSFAHALLNGENAAATELYERYARRLISLARGRLSSKLSSKTDPEDVVQSVMMTFFRRLRAHELTLHSPASLGTLLSLLTIRKCAMRGREFRTGNRSIDREVRIGPHEIDHNAIAGREPSPLEVSTFVDLVETLLSSSSEREEEIIAGLLNGDSVKEIACRLKRSERTIYRTTKHIRKSLLQLTRETSP